MMKFYILENNKSSWHEMQKLSENLLLSKVSKSSSRASVLGALSYFSSQFLEHRAIRPPARSARRGLVSRGLRRVL